MTSLVKRISKTLSRVGTNGGRVPFRCSPIYIALIGYINYFSLYFLRKSQTTTKTLYADEFFGNSTNKQIYQGWLDNAYLIPYAVGQVVYPNAVDALGSRLGWLVCLLPASLALVLVKFVQNWWQLTICLMVTAFSQSLCWPAAVKMLTKYMTNEQYKILLPIWGSCVFVGNVMGNLLSAYILDSAECEMSCLLPEDSDLLMKYPRMPGQQSVETITVRDLKRILGSENYTDFSDQVKVCRENNWRDVFWMPACAPVAISILTFLLSPNDHPSKADNLVTINSLDREDSEEPKNLLSSSSQSAENSAKTETNEKDSTEVPSMLQIMKTAGPGWLLAIGYFCVKGARYWMYYWAVPLMTKITEDRWDESEAAKLLSCADTGGLISSLTLPVLLITYTCCGRKYFLRSMIICTIVCALTIPTLFGIVYWAIPNEDKLWASILWFFYGFLLGIPDNLYSGVAVNELATYMGGNIQASLAGFVNGLGGFGPFVGSPVTGAINEKFGNQTGSWVVIIFMITGTLASIVADIFMVKKHRVWKGQQKKVPVSEPGVVLDVRPSSDSDTNDEETAKSKV